MSTLWRFSIQTNNLRSVFHSHLLIVLFVYPHGIVGNDNTRSSESEPSLLSRLPPGCKFFGTCRTEPNIIRRKVTPPIETPCFNITAGNCNRNSDYQPSKRDIDNYMRARGYPDSDYPYFERANGCGSNDGAGLFVPNNITVLGIKAHTIRMSGACDDHDKCYMRVGQDRGMCDRQFRLKMETMCDLHTRLPAFPWDSIRDDIAYGECMLIGANAFSAFVRAFGLDYYRKSQQKQLTYDRMVHEGLQRGAVGGP